MKGGELDVGNITRADWRPDGRSWYHTRDV